MIATATNSIAWVGGFFASGATLVGQIGIESGGWFPVVIQAGMAGIVVLLLLKHIPAMLEANERATDRFLKAQDAEREAFRESLRDVIKSSEKRDQAWREALDKKGVCPIINEDTTNQVLRAVRKSRSPFPDEGGD